jgi:thiamine biosynthesis lipoprotein
MGTLNAPLGKPFFLSKERDLTVLSFQAFGTRCKVKYSACESIDFEFASQKVVNWVQEFEQRYSRYLENSWLSLVNASAGIKPIPLTEKDALVLRAGSFAFFQSNQTIDPSCLPLTALWQKAKDKNQLPQEHEISEAKELVNWQNVQISEDEILLPFQGMGLDFGGFGKEYAVDQVAEKLRLLSCQNFLVDFGGDIFASGFATEGVPWKIGIEKPVGEEIPGLTVSLSNRALATSGNYRRFFDLEGKRYGHTVDHRTGYPTIHSELSASVISPSCLKSGIISTTCLMSGKQTGLRMIDSEWNVEGCIQSFDSPLLSNKFYQYIENENLA